MTVIDDNAATTDSALGTGAIAPTLTDAAKAPASVVHSHCFAPMYHEIFNDTQRQLVFAVLKRWLDDRFAA